MAGRLLMVWANTLIVCSAWNRRRPWDLRNFFSLQCVLGRHKRPDYSLRWVDIRKHFAAHYGVRGGIKKQLEALDMQFEGRPHSGIDDTRNIARIAVQVFSLTC